MFKDEKEMRHDAALKVAQAMMTAARTAPKGRGIDSLCITVVTDEEKESLAGKMEQIGKERGLQFFIRDAGCIMKSEAVVLIGCLNETRGLNCGACGSDTCAGKSSGTVCSFCSLDLGIAIGSACSIAADNRVDTRVMYSAGKAAEEAGLMPGCRLIHALPISISGKSPFFDR